MTTKESRRDPRSRALNLTVRYKSATVADFVEDHSYDISRGGLFIKTSNPFATGTLLKFEVRIVDEKTVIDGVGRVAWRREKTLGPGRPAGMGIKFIRIDDACVQLIERAVAKHDNASNQFEDGAREQGVVLSEPPLNLRGEASEPTSAAAQAQSSEPPRAPMFPAQRPSDTAPEDASEQSMLFQTSELLKSALNKVNPEAGIEAGIKQTEIHQSETPDYDDVTAEDRATLPTGSSKIPPRGVKLTSTSKQDLHARSGEEDDADEDDTEDNETEDGDQTASDGAPDATSEPPASGTESGERRRSKRPGSSKRKNPKRKKRKFSYASLPAAKHNKSAVSTTPPSDASSSTSPARHRSEFPAAAAPPESSASSFWWVAILALIAISGALYLAFSSPDHTTGQDTVRPNSAANLTPSVPELTPSSLPVVNAASAVAIASTADSSADTSASNTEDTASGSSNVASSSDLSDTSPAAATSIGEHADEEVKLEAAEPEVNTRKRTRSRRRAAVAQTPEPTVAEPAAPVVATPTAPQVPGPQAPVVPIAPAPSAAVPAAPMPSAPSAPVAPVAAPVPVPVAPSPSPSAAPNAPVAAPSTIPAPQAPAPVRQTPVPAPNTPPQPTPTAPVPQGTPVTPATSRLP